jgi:hypothetical protein
MKLLAALLAGLLVSVSAHAQLVSWMDLEGMGGGAHAMEGWDGLWIQRGLEHHYESNAPAFEGGVRFNLYEATYWGLAAHADYVWIGAIKSQGLAVPDANYSAATRSCVGPCETPLNFVGGGNDQGVRLTLEPYATYNGWRFGVDAGVYEHRATWQEGVYTLSGTPVMGVVKTPRWATSFTAGAEVDYGHLGLEYQYLANGYRGADYPYPQIWKSMHLLLAKFVW